MAATRRGFLKGTLGALAGASALKNLPDIKPLGEEYAILHAKPRRMGMSMSAAWDSFADLTGINLIRRVPRAEYESWPDERKREFYPPTYRRDPA